MPPAAEPAYDTLRGAWGPTLPRRGSARSRANSAATPGGWSLHLTGDAIAVLEG